MKTSVDPVATFSVAGFDSPAQRAEEKDEKIATTQMKFRRSACITFSALVESIQKIEGVTGLRTRPEMKVAVRVAADQRFAVVTDSCSGWYRVSKVERPGRVSIRCPELNDTIKYGSP
jgi:hypothetical protein